MNSPTGNVKSFSSASCNSSGSSSSFEALCSSPIRNVSRECFASFLNSPITNLSFGIRSCSFAEQEASPLHHFDEQVLGEAKLLSSIFDDEPAEQHQMKRQKLQNSTSNTFDLMADKENSAK
jgi:hypothetical protein